jgi:hypothetical protein
VNTTTWNTAACLDEGQEQANPEGLALPLTAHQNDFDFDRQDYNHSPQGTVTDPTHRFLLGDGGRVFGRRLHFADGRVGNLLTAHAMAGMAGCRLAALSFRRPIVLISGWIRSVPVGPEPQENVSRSAMIS